MRMPARPRGQEFVGEILTGRDEDQRLRFTEDGTFQISVFEDLHFAEGTSFLPIAYHVSDGVLTLIDLQMPHSIP